MCLTIPAKVIDVAVDTVTIEDGDGVKVVETPFVTGLAVGDWVLHINRLVIRKISPDDACEIIELLESGTPVDTSLVSPAFREDIEALHRGTFGRDNIVRLLSSEGVEQEALLREADTTRRAWIKDFICIHGIIEFSNQCTHDCLYCGLRNEHSAIERYRMTPDEIVETAREAVEEKGYKLLVLQSGEDPTYTDSMLIDIIRRIKSASKVFIFISVGERGYESYRSLKEAGASGVLFRFESSSKGLFKKVHPHGKCLESRFEHLKFFKELGYYVATGSLVGLPGQTLEDIADDILVTKRWANMVSTGPFIPTPGTPLAGSSTADGDLYLKVTAILRLAMHSARIPVVTAYETLTGEEGRSRALKSGANSLMINLTPERYRTLYSIYPDKFYDTESIFVRYGLYKYRESFTMLEERMREEISL